MIWLGIIINNTFNHSWLRTKNLTIIMNLTLLKCTDGVRKINLICREFEIQGKQRIQKSSLSCKSHIKSKKASTRVKIYAVVKVWKLKSVKWGKFPLAARMGSLKRRIGSMSSKLEMNKSNLWMLIHAYVL